MQVIKHILLSALLFACSGTARTQAVPEAETANPSPSAATCGPELSQRDASGRLIGSTRDSTTIRIARPSELRVGVEATFEIYMTGVSPLNVYAEQPAGPVGPWGRLPRVEPNAMQPLSSDSWAVRFTFPSPGCWHLHTERAGGKLAGDVSLDVLPR